MHNVCRLCLCVSAQGLTPLHESDRLIRNIRTYLRITIEDSKNESLLPNNVCAECVCKLDAMHEFGEAARRVQQTLQKLLSDGSDSLENFYIQLGDNCGTVGGKENTLQPIEIKIKIEAHEAVPSRTESETGLYKTEKYEKDYETETMEIEINQPFKPELAELDETKSSKESLKIILPEMRVCRTGPCETRMPEKTKSIKESLKIKLPEMRVCRTGPCETGMPETVICEPVLYECSNYSSDDNTLSALKLKELTFETKVDAKEKRRTRTRYKVKTETKGAVVKNSTDITLFPVGTLEEDKKWQCLTCLAYMESRKALISHYKCSHNTTSTDKDDNVKEYRVEMDVRRGEICVCAHCGKRMRRRTLKRHLRSHQSARPFMCSLCGRTYKSASDIVLHGRAHNGFKTLSCSYESCNFSTQYPGALKAHLNTHAPRYKFRCDKCSAGFNVRSWFEEHANFHTGERPFHCSICPTKFHCSRYLTSHVTQVHGRSRAGKFHPCDMCSVRLPSRRKLRAHMRVEHASEMRVERPSEPLCLCDVCGQAFHKRENLKQHRRVHTGVKPYPCSTCGKAFTKKCNLKQHERIHSGVQPYVCSQCGRAFTQRSTLIRHVQCHADKYPYVCNKCSKSFVTRAQLTVHRRTCAPAVSSSPPSTAGGGVGEC